MYHDGVRFKGQPTWLQAHELVRGRQSGFVWIGLHEPTDQQLVPIAEALGLHPVAVEDAVHAHHRPKLDRWDDCLFAVVKTVDYDREAGPSGLLHAVGPSLATSDVPTQQLVIGQLTRFTPGRRGHAQVS